MRPASRPRPGFSLVELCMAISIIGIMAAIALPRFRLSPAQRAEAESRRLVQDLEQARARAFAARAAVVLVADANGYRFFLDHDRDSTLAETAAEATAYGPGAVQSVEAPLLLERGSGIVPVPGDASPGTRSGALRFRIDRRGVPEPFGSAFTLYVRHPDRPEAVAAATITAAGNVRHWVYLNGAWR